MTLMPMNALVIGLVSLVALTVMGYWHCQTRGTWKEWPAGRSLMGLLAVIVIITANAAINILLPVYPGKIILYFGLYILMFAALVSIGVTIRNEMRRGKTRTRNKYPTHTGPVTVVVASTNEEEPHVDQP